MLKVTTETRGGSGIPIPAPIKLNSYNAQFPTGYKFPVVRLVSVRFNAEKEMKVANSNETTTKPVLEFLFKGEKDEQFTHIEFPIEGDDTEKVQGSTDALLSRIKHIWEETMGLPVPDSLSGESFADFFKNVADSFNKEKITILKDGKEKSVAKYPRVKLYLKLSYYKTNLQIPRFPNFVQKAEVDNKLIPCISLLINPQYDKTEPSLKASTSNNTGLDNDFGTTDFSDDFPDI